MPTGSAPAVQPFSPSSPDTTAPSLLEWPVWRGLKDGDGLTGREDTTAHSVRFSRLQGARVELVGSSRMFSSIGHFRNVFLGECGPTVRLFGHEAWREYGAEYESALPASVSRTVDGSHLKILFAGSTLRNNTGTQCVPGLERKHEEDPGWTQMARFSERKYHRGMGFLALVERHLPRGWHSF